MTSAIVSTPVVIDSSKRRSQPSRFQEESIDFRVAVRNSVAKEAKTRR